MSKFEVGDKFVIEVYEIKSPYGYKVKGLSSWNFGEYDLSKLKPLSYYTEKLEQKNQNKQGVIRRLVCRVHNQADEITRLLKENAELKERMQKDIDHLCDLCIHQPALDEARAEGQDEAWELAQKIFALDGGYRSEELKTIFGTDIPYSCLVNNTYTEAAAKVAEWERRKEICVGDVVTFYGKCGIVTFIDQQIRGISESGLAFVACKEDCTKTGRHIDVDAWLAQIGGDE